MRDSRAFAAIAGAIALAGTASCSFLVDLGDLGTGGSTSSTSTSGSGGGGGALVCPSGTADCNHRADDGCETDITRASDCGACGHDCLGGACASGSCLPVILVGNETAPLAVAVAGNSVYWVNSSGGVRKIGKQGGSATALVPSQAGDQPQRIRVDAVNVYWSVDHSGAGFVASTTLNGPAVTQLYTGKSPAGLDIDETQVYWADTDSGYVLAAAKNGTTMTPTTLYQASLVPYAVAVDASGVYISAFDGASGTGEVRFAEKTSSAGRRLAQTAFLPFDLAIDDKYVYWVDLNQFNVAASAVRRVKKDCPADCQPETIADNQYAPLAIAVDGAGACWANFGDNPLGATGTVAGSVRCLKHGSSTVETLLDDASHPSGIALDATALYFGLATSTGTFEIARIAR